MYAYVYTTLNAPKILISAGRRGILATMVYTSYVFRGFLFNVMKNVLFRGMRWFAKR